jgi:hypothetical protein
VSTTIESSIQVYTDIDDSWTGQSDDTNWDITTSGSTSIFSLSAVNAATYSENKMDQALWGEVILASRPSNISILTTESGKISTVRSAFTTTGKLSGTYADWTSGGVVGIAHDLGKVKGNRAATYAVGYVREEAINYLGSAYTGYYRAKYPATLDAVTYFLDDFDAAETESLAMDQDLATKSILRHHCIISSTSLWCD